MKRRQALTAGTIAGGFVASGQYTIPTAEAQQLDTTWGEGFVTPWSPREEKSRLGAGSTPVRLSCQAHRLQFEKGTSIAEQVKSVRDNGYTAVESNNSWAEANDSEIRELHETLREFDVYFYALHLGGNNCHPDRAERERVISRVSNAVETADRLGLEFILCHYGGAADSSTRPHRDNWTRETWRRGVESLKTILKNTAGSSVALGIEALNPSIVNNPWAHKQLQEDVGSDRIRVSLDPQNMIHTGTYYRTTELVHNCFDLLGEDIMYCHAKDVGWVDAMLPAFEWVVAGTGCMDFETYLLRLSHMKYPRAMFLEFLPDDQYPLAKKHIEDCARRTGVTIYS